MSQTRAGGFVVASVAVSEGAVAAPDAPLLLEPEQRQALQAFLEPRAPGIDAGTTSLRESLSFLNEWLAGAPNYDPAFPNADLTYVAQTMATAAGSDMTAAFSLWCHRMVLEYLPCAPAGSPLRERTLPALLHTEVFGSTALAAAMAHHVSGAPLSIQWRAEGDELVLNGRVNWASNLFAPHFVMVTAAAPADGGPTVIVALRGDTPGVEIQPYPQLLALQATSSSSLLLREVRLSRDALITQDFGAFITRVRPPFLILQSSFCWGLAQRALAEARSGLRGVNDVFAEELAALEERLAEFGRFLFTAAADRGASAPIRRLVQTRLECSQLATAAVALEAKIAGGRGYVSTCGTARRFREAAFLPIQAPTEGQLRWELSRSA